MPHLDMAVFAEYFPHVAWAVPLALIGMVLGYMWGWRAKFKALEEELQRDRRLLETILINRLCPAHAAEAAEPLASPEAYAGEFAPEERDHMWKGTRF